MVFLVNMKLISLNIYGGHFFEALMEFIKINAAQTDIFCFQEVLSTPSGVAGVSHGSRINIFTEIARLLPEFHSFFIPVQDHFDETALVAEEVSAGLATFVRKKYAIHKTDHFFIYKEKNSFVATDYFSLPYGLHYLQLELDGQLLTVCNLHGTAMPGNKLDTPERLVQSQKVLDFLAAQAGEKIVVGDFNLLPHTKSIRLFEEAGFSNLVKDYGIKSTRGSLLKQLHPEYGESVEGWQEFADYALVTSGITVKSFAVPDLPLSDHLPMILEFERVA